MLYRLAHWLKEKLPFLWRIAEILNTALFRLRYGKKLSTINSVLSNYQGEFVTREATREDVEMVLSFFGAQPQDAFRFFSPHQFDAKTITRLIDDKAFLFFVVLKDTQMVGYFFLRCFFHGKCFRGKIVDYRWRNRGIAKMMGRISMDVARHVGLRMFGTISKENAASLASSVAVNSVRIVEYLPNDYVYIEYLPKK